MNWIEEVYRPWWDKNGDRCKAPKAPAFAPNRWVNDIYVPWLKGPGKDCDEAPEKPW